MKSSNKMKQLIVLMILLAGSSIPQAFSQTGMAAVPFLNIEPDARSSALGFTGLTQVGNANASFWNPALLAVQSSGMISFSHSNWLPSIGANMYYDHLSLSTKLSEGRGLALDITYFNLGQQMARDERGTELGTFGNNEMAVRLAYGHQLTRKWSMGLAAQYFRSNLASGKLVMGEAVNPASGLAIDFGGYYSSNVRLFSANDERFHLGYNLASFGSGVNYTEGRPKNPLPTKLRFGWSYELTSGNNYTHRFILVNEFSKRLSRMEATTLNGQTAYEAMNPFSALVKSWSPVDVSFGSQMQTLNTFNQFGVSLGAEYWFNELIALRGGYFHEHKLNGDRQLLTAGTGVRFNRFGVDFSYMNSTKKDHPLANTVKVTVIMDFDAPKRSRSRKAESLTPLYAPMDTVYVNLSKGFEPLQVPNSTSPGAFTYSVRDEQIASLTGDGRLKLNSVGQTYVAISQQAIVPHTQGQTGYVLIVTPDLNKPIWSAVEDTVYTYLSLGSEPVRIPESSSDAPFTVEVENTQIAQLKDELTVTLLNIGTTRIALHQAETSTYDAQRGSYVMVVLPDPSIQFEDINFDFDKDLIRPVDAIKLDKAIEILEMYPFVKIRLEGHTDSFGSKSYNLNLSIRRAQAVLEYLLDRGVAEDRITTVGFSFDVPKVENNSPENRAINRRVEIIQSN
jgi:outer membrane protein OmpA-like peptidoglycan-associated protein